MKRWWRVLGIVLAVTMLFTSTVAAECPDGWNLPEEVGTVEVSMPFEPGSLGTEFDVIVGGVGEGYSISNGLWAGWCADSIVDIYALTPYPVRILSSLDPNLADACLTCADDEQWDKINYLLNHRLPGASWMDVQAAIWYLSDAAPSFDLIPWTAGPLAQVMVDDANANGVGFCPAPGQIAAVIFAVSDTTQLLFVELRQPAEGTGTPGFWKNHPEAWTLSWLTLGGHVYTQEEALALFNTPDKGDKSMTMFRALAAAELNKAAGNDTSCVDDVIAAAQQWMEAHPAGSKVKANTAAGQEGAELAGILDAYNNGQLPCASHRD